MSLLAPTLDCELKVGTQTSIFGHPTCNTMPATLNVKLPDQWMQFFKVNKLFPMWTEVSRPLLTYKTQTIFKLCLRLLFEKSHLSSSQETTLCSLTNRFSGTHCYIYRFKLSFKKPLNSSIQKSNQLVIQKATPAYWFSK